MKPIQMVDLKGQYLRAKTEIDAAIQHVLESAHFIQGESVALFENNLSQYTGSKHVISCGNGTDALIAALMAIEIGPGDEIITTPFTFIATVEAIVLVGAKPVLVDVDEETFNLNPALLEKALSPNTKAVIPVHLFGQCADMSPILEIAKEHRLKVIEDACQAIGTEYTFPDGTVKQAGTMGDIGCISFFPSKNLGGYGDGGALMTDNDFLANRLKSICRHGSSERYKHDLIGFNSRLDTIQAAILNVKLNYLNEYIKARQQAAKFYKSELCKLNWLKLPSSVPYSTHTCHQFTVRILNGNRDKLKSYLKEKGIPSAVYYPCPVHLQTAYKFLNHRAGDFPVCEQLSQEVLSLPMHTELSTEQLQYICQSIVNSPL